jgi:cell division protein FtsN
MKTSLLSLAAAFALLASTAASAAGFDHTNDRRTEDVRRLSPSERARYEAAQREKDRKISQERARYEEAQRRNQRENERRLALERARLDAQRREDQRKAAERARWEAQHRNDRRADTSRDYGYNGHR